MKHQKAHLRRVMSALFDFNAFLIVVLLTICTCTYFKTRAPRLLSVKTGCVASWRALASLPQLRHGLGAALPWHRADCSHAGRNYKKAYRRFKMAAQVQGPFLEGGAHRCGTRCLNAAGKYCAHVWRAQVVKCSLDWHKQLMACLQASG